MGLTKQELNAIALDLIGLKNDKVEELLTADYWNDELTLTKVGELRTTQRLIKRVIEVQSPMKEES